MAQPSHDTHQHHSSHQGEGRPQLPDHPFYRDNDAAMARMHADMHGGPLSGDIDRDFLAMMIPHHQGALDMAELVLRYGRDPLVRQLAEGIIAGQRIEIAAMGQRLAYLAGGGSAREEFPALSGERGAPGPFTAK